MRLHKRLIQLRYQALSYDTFHSKQKYMLFSMNYVCLVLLFVLFSIGCTKKIGAVIEETPKEEIMETKDTVAAPQMTFKERLIHLGKIKKGEQIPISYAFTNTGNANLEIDLISVCECTQVVERPYGAIKPGESGVIEVVFDSNQKDEEETIEIDIWLKHYDPVLEMPALERLQYTYEFEN